MSLALTSTELSIMRAAISDMLPDTCSIISGANSSDGQGGVSWAASGTVTAACRLDLVMGNEQNAAGAVQPFTRWVMTLPYDTAIVNTNKITHGGYTYNVVGGINTDSSWIACKRVLLERVR
jgi:hypothetical protein